MTDLLKSNQSPRIIRFLGWTKSSYYLMSVFIMVIFLTLIVWWPLAEDYLSYFDPNNPILNQIDWLLVGIFLAMSLLIMAGADFKKDIWIILVGLGGGLMIEAWGTQTNIWTYYTNERPPLWIIPAWPIASLSIDRLVSTLNLLKIGDLTRFFKLFYWIIFISFFLLMVSYVYPTFDKPLTWSAVFLTLFIIMTPNNQRTACITFISGVSLGYFLEKWGTTRLCWTYYTLETPPIFAVWAHGLAAVAFWRAKIYLFHWGHKLNRQIFKRHLVINPNPRIIDNIK
jgi:hypothetical protein